MQPSQDPGSVSLWLNIAQLVLLPLGLAIIKAVVEIRMKAMERKIDANTLVSTKAAATAMAVGEALASDTPPHTQSSLRSRAHALAAEMAREAAAHERSIRH